MDLFVRETRRPAWIPITSLAPKSLKITAERKSNPVIYPDTLGDKQMKQIVITEPVAGKYQ